MNYSVIINDRSYELPKRTIAVAEKLDKVANVDNIRGLSLKDKYAKLYDCVEDLLGHENAVEILGSDNIDEVDLSEVTLAFRKIVDAYNRPMAEYNSERNLAGLRDIPIDKLSVLAKTAEQLEGVSSRLGQASAGVALHAVK